MEDIRLMDCTLRDGANVVGKGYSADLTKLIIEGLIRSNIRIIEMGNAHGIGAYKGLNPNEEPLSDEEYLKLAQPYLGKAEIGMFMGVKNASEKNISLAAENGLKFLRMGANAGDGSQTLEGIKLVKKHNIKCRYSLMKAYVLSPHELAEEAKMVADAGLDEITIMDSAGTMLPDEVKEYVCNLKKVLNIPVGFHGHNNLGLSVANALAAEEAGASVFDCGLLGMARSAGNCATELAAAVFQKKGLLKGIDLMTLLDFEDQELIPAMKAYNYHVAVTPTDLVLGLAGAHSSFTGDFQKIALQKGVNLYRLILEVSKANRKNPSKELMEEVADSMK